MNPYNPMNIKFYSYKVEFAMRGAAHIHGVLWLDWKKFESFPTDLFENDSSLKPQNDCDGDNKQNANQKKKQVFNLQSVFDKIRNDEPLTPDEKNFLRQTWFYLSSHINSRKGVS